jgi:subtilisin family serine protease
MAMGARDFSSWILVALLLVSGRAGAELDLATVVERSVTDPDALGSQLQSFSRRVDGRIPVLLRTVDGSAPQVRKSRLVVPGLATASLTPTELTALVAAHPELRVLWSPPRRLLLDQAGPAVRADLAHTELGLTGSGVVVGIVDTGLDLNHADLRAADGTTRVAWLLDMSSDPAGKQEALETEYGCSDPETGPCAIYSGADIDALLTDGVEGNEPGDLFGHGTHVTSLAAGNGLSSSPARYVGMAPEATLIIVRATRDDGGGVDDPDILDAVKFIFARAEKMGLPAVVNLSLGGDFGGHDGTSTLEEGLSSLVGPDYPGRAVVVAAGNSGSLYSAAGAGIAGLSTFPDPIGVHSVVHVPPETTVRFPIFIGATVTPGQTSRVLSWIATRPGDALEVALSTGGGDWIGFVGVGRNQTVTKNGMTATLYNGITESAHPENVDHADAALMIEGQFPTDTTVWLEFRGRATCSAWVQGEGGVDPAAGAMGVWLAAAQREGTVAVPAADPDLIAVGATMNRTEWLDATGDQQHPPDTLGFGEPPEVVSFSSAGPNAINNMKPDILAPGAFVAAALSRAVDPRTDQGKDGMFSSEGGLCSYGGADCMLVDDTHALSLGTSMAAPIVAGAVALLLQREPTLDQVAIRSLLQAGAQHVESPSSTPAQIGVGMLDVVASLDVLTQVAGGDTVDPGSCWLSLSKAFAHPDSKWPIEGTLHLRDAQNRPVDMDESRVTLTVDNGQVLSAPRRDRPGFYRFSVSANDNSANKTLIIEARADGKEVASSTMDIAVDVSTLRGGVVAGRGCSLAKPGTKSHASFGWLALVVAGWSLRRTPRLGIRRSVR